MKRLLIAGGVVLGWFAVLTVPALAQPRPPQGPPINYPIRPITSPALSPYLNMLRGGNPAANYYLGVVPEQQRRSNEALYGRTFNEVLPRVEYLEDRPRLEEELVKIGSLSTPAGFSRVPPPTKFNRSVPGFGTPLPMPPPVRSAPAQKPPAKPAPMEKVVP